MNQVLSSDSARGGHLVGVKSADAEVLALVVGLASACNHSRSAQHVSQFFRASDTLDMTVSIEHRK